MTPDPVKAAMTAEEWAAAFNHYDQRPTAQVSVASNYEHALAALCLHGQPFGFTHEMVATLHEAVSLADEHLEGAQALGETLGFRLLRVAELVEALLPPKEPKP